MCKSYGWTGSEYFTILRYGLQFFGFRCIVFGFLSYRYSSKHHNIWIGEKNNNKNKILKYLNFFVKLSFR